MANESSGSVGIFTCLPEVITLAYSKSKEDFKQQETGSLLTYFVALTLLHYIGPI